MDHADVLERLELAAVEPAGLERLLGADTRESTAIRHHLAECRACRAELDSLRASVRIIHGAVQFTPSDELRHRTLEFVERSGRKRPATDGPLWTDPRVRWTPSRVRWPSLARLGTFAAGVTASALIAGLVTWGAVSARLTAADAAIAEQRSTIAALGIIADWSLRVGADPAARHVRLEAADGGAQAGTVLLAGDRTRLVMVASGLPVPAEGLEYRCWIEASGGRMVIGRMYRAGELAYWAGELEEATLDGELRFGVTLVESAVSGLTGTEVLVGES